MAKNPYGYPEFIKSTGYGTGAGLKGWNCYHDFHPFIPGIDEPNYTPDEIEQMNAEENIKRKFGDKEYTAYEATQRQRELERVMRKYGEESHLLELGGADEDTVLATKVRYQTASQEYAAFSKAMGLPQQRERIRNGMESLAVNKAKDELAKEPWKFWEAENYKNSTESGLLILPDGTTKDFDGIEHHVVGKEEDIKLMDGAIFTHNHPTDNTFSQNDIITGIVKGNLKEMHAVTSTGDVHILVNNGASEQQRKKFSIDYQQRRMKAANVADAKIRKGEKINKDEYVKSRLETFMSEHAEEYNLSYTKHQINILPKNIIVQGGFNESKIISDDIKDEICKCLEKVQSEYNVKVDIYSFEDVASVGVPFQFVPVNDNGKYKSKFVINKGFNWEESLDKLNERIYNKNYRKGILASQNTEDLIYHEMAHFMTFQDCEYFSDYISLERFVRQKFKDGVSMYSDVSKDGAETIAEAFVRIKNNEAVRDDVKKLVSFYVERWRK